MNNDTLSPLGNVITIDDEQGGGELQRITMRLSISGPRQSPGGTQRASLRARRARTDYALQRDRGLRLRLARVASAALLLRARCFIGLGSLLLSNLNLLSRNQTSSSASKMISSNKFNGA
jgi:hypothetical protein